MKDWQQDIDAMRFKTIRRKQIETNEILGTHSVH
jgi:hypothetical protein